MTRQELPTPFYVVREQALRSNLQLIADVAQRSGAEIIIALKANALWRTFSIIGEYCHQAAASSLAEMRLAREEMGAEVHSYCPVYTDATFDQFLEGSTHITFNSLGQYARFAERIARYNATHSRHVSPGLRVNPHCSVIETDMYNPALPGSRFGADAAEIEAAGGLPEGLEGLHFHALCESDSHDLAKVLEAFEAQFGRWLPSVKWINMGGGHLMTRKGYDIDFLVELLKGFKARYPWLRLILEPGSAFTWRTGELITTVLDVVEHDRVRTGIIDASFACHMPDTLEMPYLPAITEASEPGCGVGPYRLGGNSCLSGDWKGDWWFDTPLEAGRRLTLEDMNHYTTVKTTMFNGIAHPDLVLEGADGECRVLRHYDYEDYKSRMS